MQYAASHNACMAGNIAVVKLLCDTDNVNINIQNEVGDFVEFVVLICVCTCVFVFVLYHIYNLLGEWMNTLFNGQRGGSEDLLKRRWEAAAEV